MCSDGHEHSRTQIFLAVGKKAIIILSMDVSKLTVIYSYNGIVQSNEKASKQTNYNNKQCQQNQAKVNSGERSQINGFPYWGWVLMRKERTF
jgi:hypothetical protein